MPLTENFPDIEKIVSKFVRMNVPCKVFSSVPHNEDLPYVLVRRVGGLPLIRERLDRARIQFDVFATNKSEARALASAVRVAAFDMEDVAGIDEAFVTYVDDEMGLTFLPDNEVTPPIDRYTFGLSVCYHSNPVVSES